MSDSEDKEIIRKSRDKEINIIEHDISEQLSSIDIADQIPWLSIQIDGLQSELYGVKTKDERLRIENHIDVLKSFIERIGSYVDEDTEGLWQGYPDLNDPQFNMKIYEKQEFYKYKIPKKNIASFIKPTVKGVREFIKEPTQNFIATYLSPNTPYNGLLLWLGVGVGKTCAAVSVAEGYRKEGGDLTRSKIIILLPTETLAQTWKNEIFNVKKYLRNTNKNINVQCTGSTYSDELGNTDDLNEEQITRKVRKIIGKYYEFIGYRKFANYVREVIEQEVKGRNDKEYLKIQVIRKKYSNRIFILDEVHQTREYASKNARKDISEVLELIARYGENNKFILASATPMYNSADEIVEILNLLLLNDKRAPIESGHVFKNDGLTLTDHGRDILIQKSRGYISYLRGEDPVTMPTKIYPELNYPVKTYQPRPIYKFNSAGKLIPFKEDEYIHNLLLVKDSMSEFQYEVYKSVAMSEEKNADNFSIPSTQASNIVYPVMKDGVEVAMFGDDGFDECFEIKSATGVATENKSDQKIFYKTYNAYEEGISFLDESRLEKYSSKLYNILQLAKNSTGVIFYYSRFLKPGILSLALMLEQNGYARYSPGSSDNNMLAGANIEKVRCYCGKLRSEHSNAGHEFKQGKYIYLTGEMPKKTLNDLIDIANGLGNVPNLYGENIKFILGSEVLEEGINMRNVREVHVLNPWYHFNRIEQIVGRAIRKQSHLALPENERNVSVFLHCATIPKQFEKIEDLNMETTDEKNYRIAYDKSLKTAKVARILKRNAVDCMLNKNGNQLTVKYFGNTPLHIITSQGVVIKNRFYGNMDNEAICDYSKCEYSCVSEPKEQFIPVINTDTYEDILSIEDLSLGKKYLASLFRRKNAYTIEEILEQIDRYFNVDHNLIYRALNVMVLNRDPLYDTYKREGYIAYTNPYYIFIPKELANEFSSLYSLTLPLPVRNSNIIISEIDEKLVKVEKKKVEKADENQFIGGLRKFINRVEKDYIKNTNIYGRIAEAINHEFIEALGVDQPNLGLELLEQYFIFGVIDRLPLEQKVLLLSYVLSVNIKNGGIMNENDKLEKMVFRFYDKQGDSNRYSIFRQQRDLDNTTASLNLPVLFRLFKQTKEIAKDGTAFTKYELLFYEYKEDLGDFGLVMNPIRFEEYSNKFGFHYDELKITDADKVYGYIQEKERRSHAKIKAEEEIGHISYEPEFYLVNRRNHIVKKNKDDTLQQKSEIKGAVCGTSTDKTELIKIIKFVLEVHSSASFEEFLKEKSKVNKHFGLYDDFAKSGSLCEIIELVLRHRQYIQPNSHFFFNYEEWLYLRSVRSQIELESKLKAEEAKLMKPKVSRGRKPAAGKK